jgi:hypothetical protein
MFNCETRYERAVIPVLCCQCNNEWDGARTRTVTDVVGNVIKRPICTPCHTNDKSACKEFVRKAMKLLRK